mmetsp:Transcript_8908/g.18799  ORF Transcript_8908/g.18799 Transcript_8908/m.18799 type:complete len:230 (+) Transcript_8908:524-1213(+)
MTSGLRKSSEDGYVSGESASLGSRGLTPPSSSSQIAPIAGGAVAPPTTGGRAGASLLTGDSVVPNSRSNLSDATESSVGTLAVGTPGARRRPGRVGKTGSAWVTSCRRGMVSDGGTRGAVGSACTTPRSSPGTTGRAGSVAACASEGWMGNPRKSRELLLREDRAPRSTISRRLNSSKSLSSKVSSQTTRAANSPGRPFQLTTPARPATWTRAPTGNPPSGFSIGGTTS